MRSGGARSGGGFRKVGVEPGDVDGGEVPIFSETPGAVALRRPPLQPVQEERVLGVAGSFILRNVLSAEECADIVTMAETMGFSADTPTLRNDVRDRFRGRFGQLRAPRCVWLASEALNAALFSRLRGSLPQSGLGGSLCGLNRRWRIYRYTPGQQFLPHLDDGYKASYLDASGQVATDPGRRSLLTVLVYLTGGLDGGQTRFWVPGENLEDFSYFSIKPVPGNALLFFHGSHPLSPIHEGCGLAAGTKYVLRGDVLYDRGDVEDHACADFHAHVRRWPHIYAGRLKWERIGREGAGADWEAGGRFDVVRFLETALGAGT